MFIKKSRHKKPKTERFDIYEYFRRTELEEQRKNEIWKKTWHIEYAMFSFSPKMFGWVRHNWYPSGSWEAPLSEYDFDWAKGFELYDSEYKSETIDEILNDAREWRDYEKKKGRKPPYSFSWGDWRVLSKVYVIPMLCHKKVMVGYIRPNGEKVYFYKKNTSIYDDNNVVDDDFFGV